MKCALKLIALLSSENLKLQIKNISNEAKH